MGTVDTTLARELRTQLALQRAVESGTYLGITAKKLAGIFPQVTTIEVSQELHAKASEALKGNPNVTAIHGHSAERLAELDKDVATLYFLDGHWSAGSTSGQDDECPVLREIAAIGAGQPGDCLIIDDARLFATAPPPPMNPSHWPHLLEVVDLIRELRPDHLVTVVKDQVISVPEGGRAALDRYGWRTQTGPAAKARGIAAAARGRLARLRS